MSRIIEVQELSLPELAVFADLKRSDRPASALFLAESPTVIDYALKAGCKPVSMLMERRHIEGDAADVLARCPEIPVYTADRAVLAALTGVTLHRGVLCAMHRPQPKNPAAICAAARRVAVLVGMTDPTDVGAVFRSAAALGVDAVLLDGSCGDPLHRRAVRVSMGGVFQIPWAYLPPDADGLPNLEPLRQLGFRIAAPDFSRDAAPDNSLPGLPRLALILQPEGTQPPDALLARCDLRLPIPLTRGVPSLPIATASAVAFWQMRARE